MRHIYWLLLPSLDARRQVIEQLRASGIQAGISLRAVHSSPPVGVSVAAPLRRTT
jgi:hypothetical protein